MAETIKGVVQTNKGPVKIAGETGATFTPHVSDDFVLSWTNDQGLDNPPEVQLPVGGESAIYIGENEPDDENTLVWIDTANDAVKYRDPETGGFVAVAIGNGTSASVEIDATLTVSGAAADAAAVGEALGKKYSAENEPPYPVKSVCGRTGAVSLSAGDVGADPSGSAKGQITAHNTSGAAHNDIRLLISGLTTRLNALADSDDTTLDQLSEIVEYIKANKTLIDSITTSKVSVADIIDNLTTSVSNQPLSANMGVELKKLIDEKIGAEALTEEVQTALTEAKESGEFDGADGSDYVLTESDKTEIAQEAAELVDTSGYATTEQVDKLSEAIADYEKILTVTSDELAEMSQEELAEKYTQGVRLLVVSEGENLVPTAIGSSGVVLNGCGYLTNYRLNSSGEIIESDRAVVTGFMPCEGKTIEITGGLNTADNGGQYVATYDSAFNLLYVNYLAALIRDSGGSEICGVDNIRTFTINTSAFASATNINGFMTATYIRVSINPGVGGKLRVRYI